MDILDKKYQAIEEFKQRLLESKAGKNIAKIVLFGSMLRGEAKEDSDIDLMIAAFDSGKLVEQLVGDISYDILLNGQELIQPLVCPISEWIYPREYLVYRVKKIGKEVYSMEEKEIRYREANEYFKLAQEYFELAKRCLEIKGYRGVCDLGYNAAELCVKGMLLFEIDEIPSSHGGLVNQFGFRYVEEGKASRELGKRLNIGLKIHSDARYKFHAEIGEREANEILELADEFIKLLREKLK